MVRPGGRIDRRDRLRRFCLALPGTRGSSERYRLDPSALPGARSKRAANVDPGATSGDRGPRNRRAYRDLRCQLDSRSNAVLFSAHSMGVQVALELLAIRQPEPDCEGLLLMCGTFGRVTTTFHGTDLLDSGVLPSLIRGTHAMFPSVASAPSGAVLPAALAFRVACAGGELDTERIQEEDFHRYWDHAVIDGARHLSHACSGSSRRT